MSLHSNLTQEKRELRRVMATHLEKVAPQDQQQASSDVLPLLENHTLWKEATGLLGYWPMDQELSPIEPFHSALGMNKNVGLVRIADPRNRRIEFRLWNGLEESLLLHSYGMKEPDPTICPLVDFTRLPIVLKNLSTHDTYSENQRDFWICFVPGLAFDEKGNRLGRGAGYYDRWIKKQRKEMAAKQAEQSSNTKAEIPNILFLGFCYDFQIVSRVPHSEQDEPVDGILTPSGITLFTP